MKNILLNNQGNNTIQNNYDHGAPTGAAQAAMYSDQLARNCFGAASSL
jgi:hypothetical protein